MLLRENFVYRITGNATTEKGYVLHITKLTIYTETEYVKAFTNGHWRTQRGVRGFNPPTESSKIFVLCVCKIYSLSPAVIFIKS